MKFKKHNQNGGTYTCIDRDCLSFLESGNFTNKANSHTPKVEIHTRPQLCHFGRYVVRAKPFGLKSFVPVTGLECSYGKIFIPVTEISVTGPARPLIWTHRYFYKEKSGEARYRKPSQPGWPGSYEEALSLADLLTKRSSVNKDAMTIFQWTSKIAMSNLRSILINTFSERKVCKDENLAIVLAYNLFIHPSSSRDPARAVKRFTRTN